MSIANEEYNSQRVQSKAIETNNLRLELIKKLNETLDAQKAGVKLVVDEGESLFLVPSNFHIQTKAQKVNYKG